MPERFSFSVSKDGKVYTVNSGNNSKQYSRRAFLNQYKMEVVPPAPGSQGKVVGTAIERNDARPVKQVQVSKSADAAKSKAENKAAKSGVKALNKAKVGEKLLGRTTGGISGAGAKSVNPVYRMMGRGGGGGLGGIFGNKVR